MAGADAMATGQTTATVVIDRADDARRRQAIGVLRECRAEAGQVGYRGAVAVVASSRRFTGPLALAGRSRGRTSPRRVS